jgi:ribonuclease Z
VSFKLNILGYNSAIPTIKGTPTSHFLEADGKYFLIDCGEGTQVQLRKAKAKFSSINHIFISHLHGDHCFGLPGLVSSFRLLGRDKPLHIYGPKGIKEMLECIFRLSEVKSDFELIFHELSGKTSEKIYEDKTLEVYTIPLKHRIYCNGYLFKQKNKERRLNMPEVDKYPEIETCDYFKLKAGEDFTLADGYTIPNAKLTLDPHPTKSYAFCSDTKFKPDIVPIIQGVDLLYHEATFLHDLKDMADYTGHTTALEAATIARDAGVKKLILGHFSNRYTNHQVFLDEAKPVFPETYLPQALSYVEI